MINRRLFVIPATLVFDAVLFLCGVNASYAEDGIGTEKEDPKQPNDLGERLIRKALSGEDEDLMDLVIRKMGDVAQRLEIQFDPGHETQQEQERIVHALNEAIRTAAAQTKSVSRSSKPAQSDKRREPEGRRRPAAPRSARATSGQAEPEESFDKGRGTAQSSADGRDGELRESRGTWGHLPMRARDEIQQGAEERSLERFRAWIERYYRALQESEE